MAGEKEIKIKYSVINAEFNSKIKSIGDSVKKLDKEFKLQKETMKHSAMDSQKLEASLNNLQQKYDLARQKTEQIRAALEQSKQMFGENSKETQKWANQLIQAETNEARLKNAITETNAKLEKAKTLESESAQASQKRQEALKSLSAEQEKLKSSSEKLSKEYELQKLQMGDNAKYSDQLKAKQEYLGKAFENSKAQVENLEKQLELSKKEYGENSTQVDKLEKELIEAKISMHNLGEEVQKANDKFENFKNRTAQIGEKVGNLGKSFSAKVTAPIMALGGASVVAFNEIDAGLDIVTSKTGATGEAAKGLEQDFKNVYGNFPATSEEVGNAIGEVNTQFGITGEKLQEASKQVMMFAHINGADVTQTTLNAKKAIEQYRLSATDLGTVLDVVTKTAQNTGQDVNVLFDSVVKGAPAFKAMGLSAAEATAWMGQLGQSGIDSAKATTAMTKAMTYFAGKGQTLETGLSKLQKELKGNSSEMDKLNLCAKIFGAKNGPIIFEAIKKGTLDFSKFKNIVNESKGATEQTFKKMTEDSGEFQIAMNQVKLAGADLGKAVKGVLAPMLLELGKKIREATEWFQKLSPQAKENIVKFGMLAAAIGPVLVVVGQLITSVGSIVKALSGLKSVLSIFTTIKTLMTGAAAASTAMGVASASSAAGVTASGVAAGGASIGFGALSASLLPIIGIIAAVVAAIAGIILVIKNWGAISKWFKDTWKSVCDGVKQIGQSLGQFFSNLWNGVKTATTNTWNGIKSACSNTWNGIKTSCTNTFNAIGSGIKSAWEGVKSATSQAWSAIQGSIQAHGGGIKGVIGACTEAYKSVWVGAFNVINQATGGKLGQALNTVRSVTNNIKNAFVEKLSHARDFVKGAIDRIRGFFNFHWSLPKIKLPHFSIKGKFSLDPPSIPSFGVSWYKTGGIATGPSIVGIGEAGNEAVVPLSGKYMQPFAQAVAKQMTTNNSSTIIINMNNTIKETADFRKGIDLIDRELRKRGATVKFARGGI